MMVLLRTANVPPVPWVGTGMGGTRDEVTGEEMEVCGSVVGG